MDTLYGEMRQHMDGRIKEEEELTNSVMDKISLSKDKVNLKKHVVSLSKVVVDLSKKSEVNIGSTQARVVFVLDYSGSMRGSYGDGRVQETLTKLVPLGLTFDDNGTMDVILFQDDYLKLEDLTIDNYENYVNDIINKSGYQFGGTRYAPVLKAIIHGGSTEVIKKVETTRIVKKGLFKRKEETVTDVYDKRERVNIEPLVSDEQPTFVLFITDGDNFDKEETDSVIRKMSKENLFVQFVGIGNDKFDYLTKLDDLDGREVDNTGFVKFEDIAEVSDTELYTKVLEQFADWLKITQ